MNSSKKFAGRKLSLLAAIVFVSVSNGAWADNLSQIYELAVSNDPQIRAAEALLKANQQVRQITKSSLLPQLNAQASYREDETDGEFGNSNSDTTTKIYGANLSQVIFDLPTWYTYKQGDAQAKQAEAEYLTAKQDLIIRTTDAYLNVLRAVDNLITIQSEEKAFSSQLEQTEQRFEVGLIAITDVHEAQASYDDVTARLLLAKGNLGIAFENLSVLTGQQHLSIAPLSDDFPILSPDPVDVDTWVEMALANNFSLSRAKLAKTAANFSRKAQSAGHLPSLNLGVSYSKQKPDGSVGVFRVLESSDTKSLALTLDIPLYSGGRISGQRKQAYYQYRQAEEILNSTKRNIIQNTRNLHLSVATDVSTVKARKQAIRSSETALEATQAGYDVGTRNLVDVLGAERALFQARRDYFNARYTYILNLLNLYSVAGSLTSDKIDLINRYLNNSQQISRPNLLVNTPSNEGRHESQSHENQIEEPFSEVEAIKSGEIEVVTIDTKSAGTTSSLDSSSPVAALTNWSKSWQAVDVENFLDFYSSNFKGMNASQREAWVQAKSSRLNRKSGIAVILSEIEVIEESSDQVVLEFIQKYTDDAYSDTSRKRVHMAFERGAWKITNEQVLSVDFN